MAVDTVTLTATMDWQDGEPFDGFIEVCLNRASKTETALVGPRFWRRTANFVNGTAQVQVVPNSAMEDGTYYKVRIWKDTGASGLGKKILEAVAVVPNENCSLRDVITIAAPATPSALDMVQMLTLRAEAAATSASASSDSASASAASASASARQAAAEFVPMVVDSIDDITEKSADGFYYIKTDDIEE